MAFVKVLKNKAFFRRFQVQKRRRREGKTDFQARRKMVRQDKNKYNSKKHRLVVRFTNSKVICQIVYASIVGDHVVASAQSTDLAHFGITCGLKNYAAAYATGLLVARRALKKFGLDGKIKGKPELNGEEWHVEEECDDVRSFKCILDVGLRKTTVGARMWGCLKGAADGGLHIPYSTKNFPGYKAAEEKGAESEYDAEAHKERIFGGHVKDYMEMLKEEDPTKYEAHFSRFIKNNVEGDGLEDMYIAAHKKIRENPDGKAKGKKAVTHTRQGNKITSSDGTEHQRSVKLTLKQRREKVQIKIRAAQDKMAQED